MTISHHLTPPAAANLTARTPARNSWKWEVEPNPIPFPPGQPLGPLRPVHRSTGPVRRSTTPVPGQYVF